MMFTLLLSIWTGFKAKLGCIAAPPPAVAVFNPIDAGSLPLHSMSNLKLAFPLGGANSLGSLAAGIVGVIFNAGQSSTTNVIVFDVLDKVPAVPVIWKVYLPGFAWPAATVSLALKGGVPLVLSSAGRPSPSMLGADRVTWDAFPLIVDTDTS